MQKSIRRVKFTKAIAHLAKIRDQNPSLGMIFPGEPHQLSPNAPNFEDRSEEETEWQKQGAREAASKLAKSVFKLKEKNKATFKESRWMRMHAKRHERTVKPVVCRDENHEHPTVVCSEQTSHPREGQNLILEEETNHDRTETRCLPSGRSNPNTFLYDSTNFNVEDETKHDRTEKPVVGRDANHERSMLNEVDIDFRIPGLPHSDVKQADNHRVRELVKKIENHPSPTISSTRSATKQSLHPVQCDIQENDSGPGKSGAVWIVRDRPKTQCKECLSYWSEGIVFCTCGHLLKESEANRGAIQNRLDLLSIPNYVIKKGRPRGYRYGKTPQQKEYHQANNLKKRCIKRGYQGIHDRFLIDSEFRAAQLEHDRDDEVCIKMDELAEKDFSHYVTDSEYFR